MTGSRRNSQRFQRFSSPLFALALLSLVALIGVAAIWRPRPTPNPEPEAQPHQPPGAVASGRQPGTHPQLVRVPSTPRVDAGMLDALQRPVSVSCAACHDNLRPDPSLNSAAQLSEFHQGLSYDHGSLACLACHNADDYNALRLADGRAIEFAQVQLLCAQCHAPQARDFERGVHGGMLGYWDRERGPQRRKNCIDCHDPHAPAFPSMLPGFHPHDRFLEPSHGGASDPQGDAR